MSEEKKLSGEESLKIITEMIGKAKHTFHENGTSAILWGSVIGIAGLVKFAEFFWHFSIGFDIWLVVLAAIIPQIFISIRESRNRKVVTHAESVINVIWIVYGISIFALVFYFKVIGAATDKIYATEGLAVYQKNPGGSMVPFHFFALSSGSLLLMLYAIPTLVTGVVYKFKPMIIGAVLCYIFFVISCFTNTAYDMLLNGFAGILNWLIPGIILKRKFTRNIKKQYGI